MAEVFMKISVTVLILFFAWYSNRLHSKYESLSNTGKFCLAQGFIVSCTSVCNQPYVTVMAVIHEGVGPAAGRVTLGAIDLALKPEMFDLFHGKISEENICAVVGKLLAEKKDRCPLCNRAFMFENIFFAYDGRSEFAGSVVTFLDDKFNTKQNPAPAGESVKLDGVF